jgi:hypothetical protein
MTEPDKQVGADDSGSSAEEAGGGAGTSSLEEEQALGSAAKEEDGSCCEGASVNGAGGGAGGATKMFECDVCNMKFSNGCQHATSQNAPHGRQALRVPRVPEALLPQGPPYGALHHTH